jgi:hypothetical protein
MDSVDRRLAHPDMVVMAAGAPRTLAGCNRRALGPGGIHFPRPHPPLDRPSDAGPGLQTPRTRVNRAVKICQEDAVQLETADDGSNRWSRTAMALTTSQTAASLLYQLPRSF